MQFSHLHCHTQYALLDGQADSKKLIKKAKTDTMSAVAITENRFGLSTFIAEILNDYFYEAGKCRHP